jgi:hypothetical protein
VHSPGKGAHPSMDQGVQGVLNHSRHEEMWFASSYHTEMALRLGALWVAVSSTIQFMLGHSPTKAFQADIVREMLARFWGVRRAVLALKNSGSRVCDPILGLPDDRVQPTVCPEEAAR